MCLTKISKFYEPSNTDKIVGYQFVLLTDEDNVFTNLHPQEKFAKKSNW